MTKAFDGAALGKQLVLVVRDYVSRATAAISDRVGLIDHRLMAMESRVAEMEKRLSALGGKRPD